MASPEPRSALPLSDAGLMPYTRDAMVDAMPPAKVSRPPTPAPADAPLPRLDAAAARRVLVHLLAASPEAFGGTAPPLAALTDAARLDEDGLGCDSLARLDLAARVAELFDLARLGREDLLLARSTVGAWAALAAEGWGGDGPRRLVFRTSGSSGAPIPHAHAAADLGREVAALADRLGAEGPIRRVLALVRPHHIYGFLLSVALPARLGVPVIDLAGVPDGLDAAAARLTADGAGTLVVAAPPQWRYLAAVLPDRPTHAVGVSSTGALDPAVADRLVAGPLQALIEIFGSTETAGLGTIGRAIPPIRIGCTARPARRAAQPTPSPCPTGSIGSTRVASARPAGTTGRSRSEGPRSARRRSPAVWPSGRGSRRPACGPTARPTPCG
jgi:acyl-CoA synthetase (AMP-forming)/AMP-acid ligase II